MVREDEKLRRRTAHLLAPIQLDELDFISNRPIQFLRLHH